MDWTGRGDGEAHAVQAFSLLGDDTRLSILLALWNEYDPHEDDNAVSFSRIFDQIDHDDRGNVSYHLSKLKGQFLRQQGNRGGYELREPGLKLVRAVIAGAGIQDVTYPRTEIDEPCPFCDAPTAISYREGVVLHTCTECEGVGPSPADTEGFLSAVPFDPAGVMERTAEEIRAASAVTAHREVRSLFDGLCPACSGPVDGWLETCPDHDSTGACNTCGRRFAARARFECLICKKHSTTSPKGLALFHPAVIAFYDDHGISARARADDVASVQRMYDLMDDHEMAILEHTAPRVMVTATCEGDRIRLTFDETAAVVDVDR